MKERAHDLRTAGGGSERRSFYRQYFFLPFSSELHESSSRSLSSHFTRSLADCALHAMHIPRFFTTVKVLVVFTNFHHSSIFFSLSVFFLENICIFMWLFCCLVSIGELATSTSTTSQHETTRLKCCVQSKLKCLREKNWRNLWYSIISIGALLFCLQLFYENFL